MINNFVVNFQRFMELLLAFNNIIYIKLKDLWSQQQIKILHDLLKHITEEKNKTQRNCYINATEKILDGKDKQIALLLEKIASGY